MPPASGPYDLKRCRDLLTELGEAEPQLPPFDPTKVEPIPYEAEIGALIEELRKEALKKQSEEMSHLGGRI
jgi:hypothetical protein